MSEKILHISDFHVTCRTCLGQNKKLSAMIPFPIFEEYFGLQMNADNRLPTSMCDSCIDFVSNMIHFKTQCLESESFLSKLLNDEDLVVNEMFEDTASVKSDDETLNVPKGVHLACDICNETFRQPKQLAKHRATKHGVDDFLSCKKCNHVFQTESQLENHMKRHEKTCQECGKHFESAFKLNRHKIVHQRKRQTFFCRFCSKSFSRTDTLQEHTKRLHGDKPRLKTVCNLCGKSVYNVTHHMKQKHTSRTELPFPCELCDKAFAFKSMLQTHLEQVHAGRKDGAFEHLCSVCGKQFKTKGELKSHMDIHSVERKHVCTECGKKYKTHSALWRHERVHSGKKPFVCNYCSKAFTTKVILANHIRTHTGEKPYTCNICSRAFSVPSTLTTHKKLIHGN